MNERIKEIRKDLGLNQQEFGERIGLKQTTITCYEKRDQEAKRCDIEEYLP